MSQADLLIDVIGALESEDVDYMLTGSLVSSLQGEPRATHDIDLVIEVDPHAVEVLARVFAAPRFYLDETAASAALAEGGHFNLLDTSTGDKVDFWALTAEPFDESRFRRRIRADIFGTTVSVSAPEDTILMKLRWSAASGGSERHLNDAIGVYELQAGALDEDYLDSWAARLGIERELATVRNRSAS